MTINGFTEVISVIHAIAWPAVAIALIFILKRKDAPETAQSLGEEKVIDKATVVSVCGPVIALDRAIAGMKPGITLSVTRKKQEVA